MDETPHYAEIANEIFYKFAVNQSTAVRGFVHLGEELNPTPLGKMVIDHLELLDRRENIYQDGKRIRRRRVILPNTVGGAVAQKIFKYKWEIRGNKMIYTIWRIQ